MQRIKKKNMINKGITNPSESSFCTLCCFWDRNSCKTPADWCRSIFFNRTVGLMGLWSSNRSDDFLMSDGRLLLSADLNPPSEETLHPFGLSCEWTLVRQFAGQVQEFSPWAFFSFKILNKNVHCYYYKNVGFIGNDSRPTTFGLFPFHEELTTYSGWEADFK